ncbi:MAG TPA: four helix bundle protein [Opitutales bacterium]|nr:four helix bundle protein [Opitutales bacterium]
MQNAKINLPARTKSFALRIVRLYSALPKNEVAQVLGKQLLRSGTAVGAHYREAMHARSRAEFSSKLQTALQELEETHYWIELLMEFNAIKPERLTPLVEEAGELIAILTTSINTTKRRLN